MAKIFNDAYMESLVADYRRGNTIAELAEAYECNRSTIERVLIGRGEMPNRKDDAYKENRRKIRQRNTLQLDEDVSSWLRVQPDIEAAINRGLRMAMEADKSKTRTK